MTADQLINQERVELNRGNFALAHNHPSSVAEPSQADEQITRRLKEALALVDIRVLDHLVVGGETVEVLRSAGCFNGTCGNGGAQQLRR